MNRTKLSPIILAIISVSLFTVNVVYSQENQAPVIDSFIYDPHLVEVTELVEASITYSDPDVGDTHTIIFDWGDGDTHSGTTATSSHIYTEPGIYQITVTVEDNEGASTTMIHPSKIIVIDTDAGFTSGGGWIICPHDVTGLPSRGFFSFIAKYHGDEVKGVVNFRIRNGLSFKSTSIRWIVITGENRAINGYGLIDGETECIFTVKVKDGPEQGFDIILVDADTKEIIYDSYESDYSAYYSVIPLSGGNIATHKPPEQKNIDPSIIMEGNNKPNLNPKKEEPQTEIIDLQIENNGKALGKEKQHTNNGKKPSKNQD